MEPKRIIVIFVTLLMVFSVLYIMGPNTLERKGYESPVAITNASGVSNSSASNSSTLNLGLLLSAYSWGTMNPLLPIYSSQGLNFLFYTPLVTNGYPPDLGIHRALLNSWSHNSNYTTWTLTLKPNLKWDNGQPLDATDLAWSLNFYSLNGTPLGLGLPAMAKNAKVINSTTVTVTYKTAYPDMMQELAGGEYNVVYAPSFEKINPKDMANFSNEKNMVLDSPFYITNYTSGENPVVFTRNPYYYNGTPYYKYLSIHLFDSTSAEIAALSSGSISGVWYGGSFVSAKAFKMPGHTLYATVPSGEELINLNYMSYPTNITAVRQALAFAVNRTELSTIGYGSTNYTSLNWATLTSGYDKSLGISKNYLANYTYDTTMVANKMHEAGFNLVNGVWTNSTGSPVTLKIIYPNYETSSENIAIELSTMWTSAGFKVELETLTSTDFTSTLWGNPPNYQAVVWDGYGFGIDFNSFITNLYSFFIDYGTPVFNHNVAPLSEVYGHTVANGTFASIWADYVNASSYPAGSSQANHWNKWVAYGLAKYVPMIPLYYTYNFVDVSNSIYWGNATNHTGVFNTQSLTMPLYWDGTLVEAHPISSKVKTSLNTDIYIVSGIIAAAVIIGLVSYRYSIRRKKGKADED